MVIEFRLVQFKSGSGDSIRSALDCPRYIERLIVSYWILSHGSGDHIGNASLWRGPRSIERSSVSNRILSHRSGTVSGDVQSYPRLLSRLGGKDIGWRKQT